MTTPPARPNKWARFWFTPTDPTTLGFMRVMTGLLILYIHAVYILDLQAYFGKHGWYSLAEVNEERLRAPVQLTDWRGPTAWEESVPMAYLPIFPHRQEAVLKFIRNLAADPKVRRDQLAYLIRLENILTKSLPNSVMNPDTGLYSLVTTDRYSRDKPRAIYDGIEFLTSFYTAESIRGPQLDAFVNPALRSPKDRVPPAFLDELPQDGPNSRAVVRQEIERLLAVLPNDATHRKYVIDHFLESSLQSRHAMVEFLLDLPADATERERQIAYLAKWNQEERKAFRYGNSTFSLWFHISDPTEMAIAHGVILFIMFLFTIGLFTRVTSVLTWLAAVSYIHRTQQVLFGMDTMMNILLIYLMIGKSGAALSVDRLIARYRAARHSIRRTGGIDEATKRYLAAPPKSVLAGFALRLTQIHFCIIYLAAGMSKLKGDSWWNTNAFWDTMCNPEFTLIHFEWYEKLLRWTMQERFVYASAAGFMVVFTFVLEIGLPFLIWTRLRPIFVVLGCLFHFGIALSMGLNMFGMLMMTLLVSFVPGCAIRSQLRGGLSIPRGTLEYDPKREEHVKAAAATAAADVDEQLELSPAEGKAYTLAMNGTETSGNAVPGVLFRTLTLLKLGRVLKLVPGVRGWFAPKESNGTAVPGLSPRAQIPSR